MVANNSDDEPRPLETSARSSTELEIPLIGPLFQAPPLIIGANAWLDPPTPLQWKTIEVCVDACQESNGVDATIAAGVMATIDAAPLVAVLQEASEYATIAAIVGYKARSTSGTQVDTFDTASLRESLAGLSTSPFFKDGVKVRLLGIGRAKLSNLIAKEDQGDGQLTERNDSPTATEGDEFLLEEHPFHETVREPVMMAKMTLILDSSIRGGDGKTSQDFGRRFSSPVHAINKLSTWASRIGFLHQDRQKLVQGIQAVQARLEMLSEEWQDWDGIGDIYEGPEGSQGTTRYDPNAAFQSKINDLLEAVPAPSRGSDPNDAGFSQSKVLSPRAAMCLEMENFGLGSTPSAYSDLQALTTVMQERLCSYYSPDRVQTEEFEYSLFSWVALQSLMACLPRTEIRNAMESTNTGERLEMIYDSMLVHKESLRDLANAKGQELRDCGEECDIF